MREKWKRGKFTIDGALLRDDLTYIKAIMKDVVVLHTEARIDRNEITYWAYHPAFEEVKEGAPEYEVFVTTNQSGNIEKVEWRKK